MTGNYEFTQDEIERAFERAGGMCECCGKRLSWENRGQVTAVGAWEAHYIEGWDDPVVLCIGEPENCHLNCGHNGDLSNPGVLPEEHRGGPVKEVNANGDN